MDKKIFSYLEAHPKSSHHQIAKDLEISEIKVLSTINELKLKGLIRIDVLPLGNSIDNDCSTFYSTRGKYSNAFQDISTPFALKEYLSDTARRLENSEYIYHYTTYPIVLKMLRKKLWHLGNAKYMNDQLEYMNGSKATWKNIFFSSFMTEDKESIGMWSMYAQPWEKGIKIAIPSKIARNWINSASEILEISNDSFEYTGRKLELEDKNIKLAAVAYCKRDLEGNNSFGIEELHWSTAVNKILKHTSSDDELTGYIKDKAWSYEKEIRIRAEFNNMSEYERVAITVPDYIIESMTLTTSPLFEGNLADDLKRELNNNYHIDCSIFDGKLRLKTICQICEYKIQNKT